MIVKNKFSLFPIEHNEIWESYKKHEMAFWTTEELDFAQDIPCLEKSSNSEKHFLKYVLAFFAQSEGLINENLLTRFYKEIHIAEARCFLALQSFNEVIHAETYALQIDTYVQDIQERERLFNAIENVEAVKMKARWINKWIDSKDSLLLRLIAFGIVEAVFFSSSFCAIFYFRERALFPGLAASNDLIARDEGMHFSFSALMYRTLDEYRQRGVYQGIVSDPKLIQEKIDQQQFEHIMRDAIEIEHNFVKHALPVNLIGMNEKLMCQYVEYVADIMTKLFGFEPIFNVENPFNYMKLLDVEGKTNFFEKRVTEYKRPQNRELSFNQDF